MLELPDTTGTSMAAWVVWLGEGEDTFHFGSGLSTPSFTRTGRKFGSPSIPQGFSKSPRSQKE